jgi:hypothetical protein
MRRFIAPEHYDPETGLDPWEIRKSDFWGRICLAITPDSYSAIECSACHDKMMVHDLTMAWVESSGGSPPVLSSSGSWSAMHSYPISIEKLREIGVPEPHIPPYRINRSIGPLTLFVICAGCNSKFPDRDHLPEYEIISIGCYDWWPNLPAESDTKISAKRLMVHPSFYKYSQQLLDLELYVRRKHYGINMIDQDQAAFMSCLIKTFCRMNFICCTCNKLCMVHEIQSASVSQNSPDRDQLPLTKSSLEDLIEYEAAHVQSNKYPIRLCAADAEMKDARIHFTCTACTKPE